MDGVTSSGSTKGGRTMNFQQARRTLATAAVVFACSAMATGLVACSDDESTDATSASGSTSTPTSGTSTGTTDTTGTSDGTDATDATDATDGATTVADQGSDTTDATASTEPVVTADPAVTVPFVPGNGDTVPVQTVATLPPVAIDEPADAGTGMTFRLERLEAVQGEATGPGEIAGPAVRVTVVAVNDSDAPVLLDGTVVDLIYGEARTSAAPLSGPGAVRFTGSIEPGATATGVYVFDVPADQRAEVSVVISYLASVSPVVFTGPAPTA